MFRRKIDALRSRRLLLENLESRAMLAGNITVAVTDGVLRIQGDGASNDLQIRQLKQTFTGEWPGAKYEISGTFNGRTDTLINGQSDPVVVEGVKAGAVINLGKGNNAMRIANFPQDSTVISQSQVTIPGDVKITTVGGQDDIRLFLKNGKSVTVTGGGGPDYIQLTASTVNQLTVNTDPRPQFNPYSATLKEQVRISRLIANGDVTINGSIGRDDVLITGPSQFHGKFTADMGSQNDTLRVQGDVNNPAVFTGPITLVAAQATVEFFFVAINDGFHADLSGSVGIITTSGDDNLTVTVSGDNDFARPSLHVDLGGGNDDLFLTECRVSSLTVLGGDGLDTLTTFGENAFKSKSINNVEAVIEL